MVRNQIKMGIKIISGIPPEKMVFPYITLNNLDAKYSGIVYHHNKSCKSILESHPLIKNGNLVDSVENLVDSIESMFEIKHPLLKKSKNNNVDCLKIYVTDSAWNNVAENLNQKYKL